MALINGRPDGKSAQYIYAAGQGGVIDYRLPSWDMGSKEEASKVFQKVINGTYLGEEQLTRCLVDTRANRGGGWFTNTYYVCSLTDEEAAGIVGNPVTFVGASDQVTYIVGSISARGGGDYNLFTVSGVTVPSVTGGSYDEVVITYNTDSSVSGEFTMTDVIGDPAEILATPDLANSWVGSWIPVIPDNTTQLAKFTRKALANSYGRQTTNDKGATWATATYSTDNTLNGINNAWPTGSVWIYNYTAFAKQTKESVNKVVLNGSEGVGDVIQLSRSAYSITAESLIGKVCTSSSSKDVGSLKVNSYFIDHHNKTPATRGKILGGGYEPTHAPIDMGAPSNDSPAVKTLWYQTSDNQQLGLNFVYNELVYNAGGAVGNEWGDTTAATTYTNPYGVIKIADGQTTDTNLNGDTILIGSNELSIPYGYSKNQARTGQQDNGVDL